MARSAGVPVHSGSRWEPYPQAYPFGDARYAAAFEAPARKRRFAPLVAVIATVLPLGAAGVAVAAAESSQPASAVGGSGQGQPRNVTGTGGESAQGGASGAGSLPNGGTDGSPARGFGRGDWHDGGFGGQRVHWGDDGDAGPGGR